MHLGRADVDGGGGEVDSHASAQVGQLQCSWEMCSHSENEPVPPRRGQPPPCGGNGRQKSTPKKHPPKKHPKSTRGKKL